MAVSCGLALTSITSSRNFGEASYRKSMKLYFLTEKSINQKRRPRSGCSACLAQGLQALTNWASPGALIRCRMQGAETPVCYSPGSLSVTALFDYPPCLSGRHCLPPVTTGPQEIFGHCKQSHWWLRFNPILATCPSLCKHYNLQPIGFLSLPTDNRLRRHWGSA